MAVDVNIGVDVAQVRLSGRVGIGQAAELAQALRQGLAGAPEVVVEVGGLEALDLAGLQALCAAHRQAQRQGRGLRVAPADSPVVAAAALRAGFLGRACMQEPCLHQPHPPREVA